MISKRTHGKWQNAWQTYGFAKPVSAETVAKRHSGAHGVLTRKTTKPAMLDAQPSIAPTDVAQPN